MILRGAARIKQILQRIAQGEGDRGENEARLRKNVIDMAPSTVSLHIGIAAMVFIALARTRRGLHAWVIWVFWIETLLFVISGAQGFAEKGELE